MSCSYGEDLEHKLSGFQQMCGRIQRTRRKEIENTQIQFYAVISAPMLMHGTESWVLN
jgi:hypothetical protein